MKSQDLTTENNRRRFPALHVLLGLDAFFAGGLVALLFVNRMLQKLVDTYAARNMDAASAILDAMDDLLVYLVASGGTLLLLVPITLIAVAVLKIRWRPVRLGIIVLSAVSLVLLLVAVIAQVWGPLVGVAP